MLAGARFSSFGRVQKKLDFGCLLELDFWSLWDLPAQKTRFFRASESHFIFSSIFVAFSYLKMVPKINEKSILSVILRQDGFKEVSSGANMAREAPTHVDFH